MDYADDEFMLCVYSRSKWIVFVEYYQYTTINSSRKMFGHWWIHVLIKPWVYVVMNWLQWNKNAIGRREAVPNCGLGCELVTSFDLWTSLKNQLMTRKEWNSTSKTTSTCCCGIKNMTPTISMVSGTIQITVQYEPGMKSTINTNRWIIDWILIRKRPDYLQREKKGILLYFNAHLIKAKCFLWGCFSIWQEKSALY